MFRQIKFCSLLNMHGMYSGPAEIHCGLGCIKYRGFTLGRCGSNSSREDQDDDGKWLI